MPSYSPDSKVINAVRSPLGMAALIVLVLTIVMLALLPTGLSNEVKEVFLGVYVLGVALVGSFTVVMTFKNPRGLAYGPKEYLEESRMARAQTLAELGGQKK
jgi:hypothetical protein